MRPCLVLNDFNGGGAERLVKDLAIELDQHRGIEPVVVASNGIGELRSEFEECEIELAITGTDVSMHAVPKATSKLMAKLRELNVDVVHSHLPFSHLISRIACMKSSVPHVATYHNVRDKRTKLKNTVERMTWRLSDQIICVSNGVMQSYGDRNNMIVIYNGIDVEAFNQRVSNADTSTIIDGAENGDTIFINIARCVEVKRQEDLIKAIAELESENIHLYIVGDGHLRPDLERTVDKLGVSNQVTITGYVDQVEPYYKIADGFVSSSSCEGLPTTHVEAMASKLPIISTNIPGVTEIVNDGETGYLCPIGSPGVLADRMRDIHNGHPTELGVQGYQLARSKFSIGSIIDNHIKLYNDIINM